MGHAAVDADNQGGDPLVAIAAAHHWAAAGDDEEAFSSSLEAAAYASRLHAPAEAAALLHRALILWDSVHDPQSRYPAGRDELLCDTFAAYDAADQLPLVLPIVDAELAREAGRDDPQHALLLRLLHDEYGQYVGRPLDPRLLEQVRAAWPRLRSEPPSSMVFHALRWLGAELWPAEPALSLDACRQSVAVAGQPEPDAPARCRGRSLLPPAGSRPVRRGAGDPRPRPGGRRPRNLRAPGHGLLPQRRPPRSRQGPGGRTGHLHRSPADGRPAAVPQLPGHGEPCNRIGAVPARRVGPDPGAAGRGRQRHRLRHHARHVALGRHVRLPQRRPRRSTTARRRDARDAARRRERSVVRPGTQVARA